MDAGQLASGSHKGFRDRIRVALRECGFTMTRMTLTEEKEVGTL